MVTEKMYGDYAGKLAILETFSSLAGARWYRAQILERRFAKQIFNEPINDPRWRRRQRAGIQIWKQV